jgi:hypothetical protein
MLNWIKFIIIVFILCSCTENKKQPLNGKARNINYSIVKNVYLYNTGGKYSNAFFKIHLLNDIKFKSLKLYETGDTIYYEVVTYSDGTFEDIILGERNDFIKK